MANWQRHLDIADAWKDAKKGALGIRELSKFIAARLKALRPLHHEEVDELRDELVEEFDALAADKGSDDDDLTECFDELMERLYNWGDLKLDDNWNGKKVCWIDTIGRIAA